jgi:hypothetical protein
MATLPLPAQKMPFGLVSGDIFASVVIRTATAPIIESREAQIVRERHTAEGVDVEVWVDCLLASTLDFSESMIWHRRTERVDWRKLNVDMVPSIYIPLGPSIVIVQPEAVNVKP